MDKHNSQQIPNTRSVYGEKNKYPGHSQQMHLLKKTVAIHYTYKSF